MADKKFKLEQVLVYRDEMEKLCKQEFATAKQGFEKAQDDLQRDEEQVKKLTKEFCSQQQNLECIDELRMYSDFFARKRDEIKGQKERVEHLDLVLNERREELLEATKDKKVLESLKEKKAKEFRREMNQKELNFLDEISIQKKVATE